MNLIKVTNVIFCLVIKVLTFGDEVNQEFTSEIWLYVREDRFFLRRRRFGLITHQETNNISRPTMSQMPMETILLSNDNISVCGTTVDKLMRDLIARPCQKKKPTNNIDRIVSNHRHPKPSVAMLRFKFNTSVRKSDDPVISYVAELCHWQNMVNLDLHYQPRC